MDNSTMSTAPAAPKPRKSRKKSTKKSAPQEQDSDPIAQAQVDRSADDASQLPAGTATAGNANAEGVGKFKQQKGQHRPETETGPHLAPHAQQSAPSRKSGSRHKRPKASKSSYSVFHSFVVHEETNWVHSANDAYYSHSWNDM
uniref:Uncharacterized protein n=1 Tax=Mycena chlorophos TaxID=658473 RepID=A0ABQ0M8M7_MYCCL|nr:predicted protein [Mycena chlorophos]